MLKITTYFDNIVVKVYRQHSSKAPRMMQLAVEMENICINHTSD